MLTCDDFTLTNETCEFLFGIKGFIFVEDDNQKWVLLSVGDALIKKSTEESEVLEYVLVEKGVQFFYTLLSCHLRLLTNL